MRLSFGLALAALLAAGCAAPRPQALKAPRAKVVPTAVAPAPQPKSTPQPNSVTLALGGDVSLARKVGEAVQRHGTQWPFALIKPLLEQADLAVVNLESPAGENTIPYLEKSVLFRAEPEHLDVLSYAGIDAVSLGNNHILDYGPEVAGRTEAELRDRGIAYAGLIRGREDIPLAMLEVRGLKIAFLSYCNVCHEKFALKGSAPGSAPAVPAQMIPAVQQARVQADFVVVAMHWGREYFGVEESQRKLAASLAAAGADLIVGHHTHVLQNYERIGGALVFYGLGNLLFDQERPITHDGALAVVTLVKGEEPALEIHPLDLSELRPRPMGAGEAAAARIRWITKHGYEYAGRKTYDESGNPWQEAKEAPVPGGRVQP